MHDHPIFIGILVAALIGIATYVFLTPNLRSGLPIFATYQQQSQTSPYIGEYETMLPSGDSGGRKIDLSITADNKVTMTINYLNAQPAVVETGDLTIESQGVLVVTLTKQNGADIQKVQHLSFRKNNEELILLDPVGAGYGTNGLILKKTN